MELSLKLCAIVQLSTLVTIFFDIPIVRQVLCFLLISIVPGLLVLRLLRIEFDSFLDLFTVCVGLSVAFTFFLGLALNSVCLLVGFPNPLSSFPLISSLSISVLLLLALNKRVKEARLYRDNPKCSSPKMLPILLLLASLPPALIGAFLGYRVPIIVFIGSIIFSLFMLSFGSRFTSHSTYPFFLYLVSFGLLSTTYLTSPYLIGYDIHMEQYVFFQTYNGNLWRNTISTSSNQAMNFNAMLSITILPTVYAYVTNISTYSILVAMNLFIFSLLPLVLYRVYERQTNNNKVALLSTFFFISNYTVFYGVEPISLSRQIIGEFFFGLSLLILSLPDIDVRIRRFLFLTFGISIILSHYSLSYIYLFLISLSFIMSRKKRDHNSILSAPILLLLIIVKSLWDIYVSGSISTTFVNFLQIVYRRFWIDLFSLERRAPILENILMPTSFVNQMHAILFYVVHLFILIGIITSVMGKCRTHFDRTYLFISELSFIIILVSLAVPNIAPALSLTRFRAICMLILSPFFALGGQAAIGLSRRAVSAARNREGSGTDKDDHLGLRVVSIVLILFFLFQVGFVNSITGQKPISPLLDIERMKHSDLIEVKEDFYGAYTLEQDVFGAILLSRNTNKSSQIYADITSNKHVLTSYGLIEPERLHELSGTTQFEGQYVYLRYLNVVEGLIDRSYGEGLAYAGETLTLLYKGNKVYSNGNCEIYWMPEVANQGPGR